MTDTIHLGLPFIEGSQAQKHVTHNEALRILDSVVQIGVLDADRTAPPLTPAEGDRYIVATGATGAWTGHAKAVAVREDGTWRFLNPKLGWCAWSDADGVLLVYDGTAWIGVTSGGGMSGSVTLLGVNDTASAPNLLTVKSNAALFNAVAVAGGGTGDMRVQISKEASGKTASVVFSDAFSGRAEFGLIGSDAFKLKVSNDGTTFVEALAIDQTSGNAALPRGVALTGVISPSQITSNQNDYNPAGIRPRRSSICHPMPCAACRAWRAARRAGWLRSSTQAARPFCCSTRARLRPHPIASRWETILRSLRSRR